MYWKPTSKGMLNGDLSEHVAHPSVMLGATLLPKLTAATPWSGSVGLL